VLFVNGDGDGTMCGVHKDVESLHVQGLGSPSLGSKSRIHDAKAEAEVGVRQCRMTRIEPGRGECSSKFVSEKSNI